MARIAKLTEEEKKERIKQTKKKWRENNKERIKIYNKNYHDNATSKIKEYKQVIEKLKNIENVINN